MLRSLWKAKQLNTVMWRATAELTPRMGCKNIHFTSCCTTREGKWSTLAQFFLCFNHLFRFKWCHNNATFHLSSRSRPSSLSRGLLQSFWQTPVSLDATRTKRLHCCISVILLCMSRLKGEKKKEVSMCWHDIRQHWQNSKSPWSCCSARWKATTFRLDEEQFFN